MIATKRLKHKHDLSFGKATLDLEALIETAYIAKHSILKNIHDLEAKLHRGGNALDAEVLYGNACDLYVAVSTLETLKGCESRPEINVLKTKK